MVSSGEGFARHDPLCRRLPSLHSPFWNSPCPPPTSPPAPTLPFTLLHHTGIPKERSDRSEQSDHSEHFDLLLQLPTQEKILTWQIRSHPDTWPTTPPLATRIQDHRPIYMTYEGPLSQDRGQVTHLAHGTATLLTATESTLQIELHFPSQESKIPLSLPLTISDNQINARLPNIPLDYGISPGLSPKTRRVAVWIGLLTFVTPLILYRIISYFAPIPLTYSVRNRAIIALTELSLLFTVACTLCIWTIIKMWGKKVGWLPRTAVWISLIFNGFFLFVIISYVWWALPFLPR